MFCGKERLEELFTWGGGEEGLMSATLSRSQSAPIVSEIEKENLTRGYNPCD